MKIKKVVLFMIMALFMLSGCSGSNFDIVGMWQDLDGTVKTFNPDQTCNSVALVDIGGPSPTYNFSKNKDSDGYYWLLVVQGGYNETKFYVKVIDADTVQIFDNPNDEEPRYSLSRL